MQRSAAKIISSWQKADMADYALHVDSTMFRELLTMQSLLQLAALFALGFLLKRYMLYRRLMHIPGPWHVGFTSAWLAYHTLKCQAYLATGKLLKQYDSPIVRISPRLLITDDAALYRLYNAPRSEWKRGRWYEGLSLDPRSDNVVSEKNEARHAELRTKLMPGYSGKEVKSLEVDINKEVVALTQVVRRHIDEKKSLDFAKYASYFTLDTLTTIAFGQTAGFLTQDQDVYKYFQTLEGFLPIMELGMNVSAVQDFLSSTVVQAIAGPKSSDKFGLGAIIGKAHTEVATRFGPDAKPDQPDMLGSFIRNGLNKKECESETIVQVLAGADSTAQALRTTFWHILHSPTVYARLDREIRDAVSAGDVSFPVISDNEAKALPYLQACIREGIRMFMPLTGHAAHVVPPGGYTHKGIYLPEGAEIGVALYSMLRKEENFGPDADIFRPERFIDNEPAQIKEYVSIQELAFGYGRFTCLGQRIALMELGKAIFELLRHYDFTVVNPLEAVITQANGPVVQKNMLVRAWPKRDG